MNCTECKSENIDRIDSETAECLDCGYQWQDIEYYNREYPNIFDWGDHL